MLGDRPVGQGPAPSAGAAGRRRAAAWLTAAATFAASAFDAVAQGYPDRQVEIIAPSTSGSPPDLAARVMAHYLSQALGQKVVVTPVAGAFGRIGLDRLLAATPDGHTLGVVSGALLRVPPALAEAKGQVLALADFVPIAGAADPVDVLIATRSLPVLDVEGLIERARRGPGTLTHATPGVISREHAEMELFARLSGTQLIEVPYPPPLRGAEAVAAGTIDLAWVRPATAMRHLRAGTVRLLATAGRERDPAAPGLPTIGESGLAGFEYETWSGLVAPRQTPPEVVTALRAALRGVLVEPDTILRMERMGLAPWTAWRDP